MNQGCWYKELLLYHKLRSNSLDEGRTCGSNKLFLISINLAIIWPYLPVQEVRYCKSRASKINKEKLRSLLKIREMSHFFGIHFCAWACPKYTSCYFECTVHRVRNTPFGWRVSCSILKVNYLKKKLCDPLICFSGFQCGW